LEEYAEYPTKRLELVGPKNAACGACSHTEDVEVSQVIPLIIPELDIRAIAISVVSLL
jgi:hypothetical protein